VNIRKSNKMAVDVIFAPKKNNRFSRQNKIANFSRQNKIADFRAKTQWQIFAPNFKTSLADFCFKTKHII